MTICDVCRRNNVEAECQIVEFEWVFREVQPEDGRPTRDPGDAFGPPKMQGPFRVTTELCRGCYEAMKTEMLNVIIKSREGPVKVEVTHSRQRYFDGHGRERK